MLSLKSYVENIALTRVALRNAKLHDCAIVECGTWRGGMAAGMVEIGGPERDYYFFDSFEGLPPAEEVDGHSAKNWQADTTAATFYNNCAATLEEFQDTLRMTKCPTRAFHIHKGWFEETLPKVVCPPIAVLRLDADWYASTLTCLETLWDRIVPGGIIIIDDYYRWDGCAKAVHTFLAKRGEKERICQGVVPATAFIVKNS
jgi:O-methyltransferase